MGPISRQRMSENSAGLTACAQQRAVLPNRSRREVKASKRRECMMSPCSGVGEERQDEIVVLNSYTTSSEEIAGREPVACF
jgi:hypothetical protein